MRQSGAHRPADRVVDPTRRRSSARSPIRSSGARQTRTAGLGLETRRARRLHCLRARVTACRSAAAAGRPGGWRWRRRARRRARSSAACSPGRAPRLRALAYAVARAPASLTAWSASRLSGSSSDPCSRRPSGCSPSRPSTRRPRVLRAVQGDRRRDHARARRAGHRRGGADLRAPRPGRYIAPDDATRDQRVSVRRFGELKRADIGDPLQGREPVAGGPAGTPHPCAAAARARASPARAVARIRTACGGSRTRNRPPPR